MPRPVYRFAPWVALALALVSAACIKPALDPETAEKLQELRNLGKAFYENPGSSEQAVQTLRQALELHPKSAREKINLGLALLRAGKTDEGIALLGEAQEQDPSIPHTWFNLGIEYKKLGETEAAIEQLEHMAAMQPDEAKTQYNLGQLYKQLERSEDAVAQFGRASELDPSMAAPHFQLYNMFRRSDPDRARGELDRFKQIKQLQDETDLSEDVDWSFFAELYDPVEPLNTADLVETVSFETVAVGELGDGELGDGESGGQSDTARGGVLALDGNADHRADLLFWRDGAALFIRREAEESVADEHPGLAEALVGARGVDAGDPDDDGFPDVCVASAGGARVVPNRAGAFGGGEALDHVEAEACLWHDFDHDGDHDLFVLGAESRLYRYAHDADQPLAARFTAVEFPFEPGKHALAAVAVELYEDDGLDLVVAYVGTTVVYEDRKLGRYDRGVELTEVAAGRGPVRLDVVDLDNDGDFDVALTGAEGQTHLLTNAGGQLQAGPSMDRTLVWADLENRGWSDAVGAGEIRLNRGAMNFSAATVEGLEAYNALAAVVAVDLDDDGLTDLASINSAGAASISYNRTSVDNAWISIGLTGVKSRKIAADSRVEVKAGRLYGKKRYPGYPVVFGLGGQDRVEAVRVTWPNGLIQNETEQAVRQAHVYDEKPRLSGSCPMIFTWNGREFEYISEVLGVAPLGASLGDGKFFPVDHDEYVYLRGDQLIERDGAFEVRVTEELREVAYLDQIKLFALDRPADVEVITNEKFKAPPFPEFRLYGVREADKIRPTRAVDHRGRSVLDRLGAADGRYVDGFERTFRNTAEQHALTLDLAGLAGDSGSMLFLHGWVDWASAGTIVAGSQTRTAAIQPPVLQVRDAQGRWQTVIDDLGLPGGNPRTMAVDLTGKFLSPSREVKILTNMCVYWDEIYAADRVEGPETARREAPLRAAELRFRGFSENVVDPERDEPERFVYANLSATSSWDPTPGRYTRFGPVDPLLETVDDRYVIMGAGDELRLRFDADLPPVGAGMRRDYLLFFDGWAKEHEANTAFGDTVGPLPFHQMSSYPYPASEAFPTSRVHESYLRQYNQRPALRLNRPLWTR